MLICAIWPKGKIMNNWQPAQTAPVDQVVLTKIDDGKGLRNIAPLILHKNRWCFADMSMYVYYNPTHWKPIPDRYKE